jgi:hypothetical protein
MINSSNEAITFALRCNRFRLCRLSTVDAVAATMAVNLRRVQARDAGQAARWLGWPPVSAWLAHVWTTSTHPAGVAGPSSTPVACAGPGCATDRDCRYHSEPAAPQIPAVRWSMQIHLGADRLGRRVCWPLGSIHARSYLRSREGRDRWRWNHGCRRAPSAVATDLNPHAPFEMRHHRYPE